MKNLIKILLYSLLVLLVVAISVMIYKRSNTPENEADLTEIDEIDRILADTLNPNSGNFSSEDSMIFDLTGQVASNVGKPEELNTSANMNQKPENLPPSSNLDKPLSQAVSNNIEVSLPKSSTNNTNHATVAAKSSNTTAKASTVSTKAATSSAKSSSSTSSRAAVKTTAKTSTTAKTTTKANEKTGNFYVVAGSYIMPTLADKQVSKLKKMGYKTATKKSFNSDEYYRAVTGKYNTRAEADRVVKTLKSKGVEAFIKSN
jgi:cell division protein FtsN